MQQIAFPSLFQCLDILEFIGSRVGETCIHWLLLKKALELVFPLS